ncbi:MAG TPA: SIS domain-containing protein [Telmatospirillum sp.]|nr:SIS domain-containing protein [Telmatospirillum sp.]
MTISDRIAPDFQNYAEKLRETLAAANWESIGALAKDLQSCWRERRQVFVCGNGGSAANALHIANDLLYGIAKKEGRGLRIQALPANVSVLTCLANDDGYQNIFSGQLASLANPGDLLIVLSGSGNSPNILSALDEARRIGMRSWAILGFSGGKAKQSADHALHFAVNDMQISEDLQLVVGHMLMQWLRDQGCGE